DRLRLRGARIARRAARAVALDDEQLGFRDDARRAVGELVGHADALERALAAGELASLFSGAPRARRAGRLGDDRLRGVGILLEPAAEPLAGEAFDEGADLGVAELALRLALELRLRETHRDDRGEALAHVVALEGRFLRLEQAALLGVTVDRVGERALEPFGVHPALGRRDAVREGVQT